MKECEQKQGEQCIYKPVTFLYEGKNYKLVIACDPGVRKGKGVKGYKNAGQKKSEYPFKLFFIYFHVIPPFSIGETDLLFT